MIRISKASDLEIRLPLVVSVIKALARTAFLWLVSNPCVLGWSGPKTPGICCPSLSLNIVFQTAHNTFAEQHKFIVYPHSSGLTEPDLHIMVEQ